MSVGVMERQVSVTGRGVQTGVLSGALFACCGQRSSDVQL